MTVVLKVINKHILSQIPIVLVLLELHFDVTEGVNKAESQNHLSRGNQLLNAGQLAEALTHYHAAVDKDEQNYQAYYMRATVYLAMGKSRLALPDLNQVVKLQPTFVQARLQRGNLYLKMGKFNDAQADYEAVLSAENHKEAATKLESLHPLRANFAHSRKLFDSNDFNGAIHLMTTVIEACPWNAEFRELRAQAYENIGDLRKAISDIKPTTVLKLDNTAAYLKMSLLWYRMGEIDQSLDEVRECLKLDPDRTDCFTHYKNVKKLFKTIEAGKNKMAESRWAEAISKFQKALSQESRVPALVIAMKLKICECHIKNNNPNEGLIACKDVLTLDSSNVPALILCSEVHTQNQDYEQALEDLQRAAQIDESYPGLKEKIKTAQKLLKQSQKRDYYKILGVSRSSPKKDIIKAYRKLAREWHPDNFQDEEEKKIAEKKFIEIASAKEVLTDPEKRRVLHEGYDPLDSEDMKEWEREQTVERTRNAFKFFFQQHTGRREKTDDEPAHDRLFRSFTRHQSRATTSGDGEEFEKQFKEFQFGNLDHLKEFADRQGDEKQRRRSEDAERFDGRRREDGRSRGFGRTHRPIDHREDERGRYREKDDSGGRRDASRNKQDNSEHRGFHRHTHSSTERYHERESLRRKSNEREMHRESSRSGEEAENREQVRPTDEQQQSHTDTLKKKTKDKVQFKKKSDRKKSSKKCTMGTDGKWYCKGEDGRWKVSDVPPTTKRRKKSSKQKTQSNEKKSQAEEKRPQADKNEPRADKKDREMKSDEEKGRYTDEKGNVYIQDNKGDWYMKVDSPLNMKSKSRASHDREDMNRNRQWSRERVTDTRRKETSSHRFGSTSSRDSGSNPRSSLPRGLFYTDAGAVVDGNGRVYDRLPDGRFRMRPSNQDREDEFRRHKEPPRQSQQRHGDHSGRSSGQRSEVFRDATGNVYMKDKDGNLIKMDARSTYSRPSSTNDRSPFSSRDRNEANQHSDGAQGHQHYSDRKQFENEKTNRRSDDSKSYYYRSPREEL